MFDIAGVVGLFFIMPVVLGGFTNYFLPLMLGIPDMLYPRINNLSYWLYLLGVFFLLCGVFIEEGIGLGWTLYPTLICVDYHTSVAVDYLTLAVLSLGFSSILNSVNVVGTILATRRKLYSLTKLNLYLWGNLLTSVLLIIVLPILAGGAVMLICDRNLNCCFFDVVGGGDLIMFQHLF